uniref:Uncharacterized protein n=1 Tax=Caenorhabditis japonica TaxID=281687 RepID=A0A8R1ID64_CAEJA
ALTSHNSLFEKIDFEPVCDFKIGILHNAAIWNQRRQVHNSRIWKSKKEVSEVPAEVQEDLGILKKIDERGKKLIECKTVELPADWQKTYKLAVRRGSIIPQLYLTAIRERYPDLYEPAIHHLGKPDLAVFQKPLFSRQTSLGSTPPGTLWMSHVDCVTRVGHPVQDRRGYRRATFDAGKSLDSAQ